MPSTTPRARLGIVVILAALVLETVVAVGAVVDLRGDDREARERAAGTAATAAYAEEVSAWRRTSLDPVVSAVRGARFGDVVVLGRPTPAQSAAVGSRCAALVEARRGLEALTAPAPRTDATPEAARASEDLAGEVARWRGETLPALTPLTRYCDFHVKVLDLESDRVGLVQALEDNLVPPGLSAQEFDQAQNLVLQTVCTNPRGCAPADAERTPAYVRAYTALEVAHYERQGLLYGGRGKPCPLVELTPLCAVFARDLEPSLAAHRAFADAVQAGKNRPGRPGLGVEGTAVQAQEERFLDERDAVFARHYPAIDVGAPGFFRTNEKRLLVPYERTLRSAVPPA